MTKTQSIFVWPSGTCSDFELVERTLNRLHSQKPIRKVFVADRFNVSRTVERWAKQLGIDCKKYSTKDSEEIDRVFSNSFDLVSLSFSEESVNDSAKKVSKKYAKDIFLYKRIGPSVHGSKI